MGILDHEHQALTKATLPASEKEWVWFPPSAIEKSRKGAFALTEK